MEQPAVEAAAGRAPKNRGIQVLLWLALFTGGGLFGGFLWREGGTPVHILPPVHIGGHPGATSWVDNLIVQSSSIINTSATVQQARGLSCDECRRFRAVLCGLARDIDDVLPTMAESLRHTGELFLDYRVVIFESDSSDGTGPLLSVLQRSVPDKLIVLRETLKLGDVRNRADRTVLLAELRNKLAAKVRSLRPEFWYDLVVIGDMDFPLGWDTRGVASVFRWGGEVAPKGAFFADTPEPPPRRVTNTTRWPFQWDLVTAYGQQAFSGFYWDWAALRLRGLEFVNLIDSRAGSTWYPRFRQMLHSQDAAWIPVSCAFGGLALMHADAFATAQWVGDRTFNGCEHIGMCLSLRKSGYPRMFISPSLVQVYDMTFGAKMWEKASLR
jgi:hypothetical protein